MTGGQSAPRGLTLRGRRDECAVLDALLEGARAGRSGVLVVRGEAGVGKTALLDYAIGSASDMLVVRASGVESEMELAFAALHQLCAPLLDRLEGLPAPQRRALEITFGLSEGPGPDRFFVGLAVLGLLSEVAEERPLLCVIDDAQWLDRASAQAFAFVARRLLADSVVMLFAAREPSDETAGLPELVLEGLRGADARSLLASVLPGRLDERIADELLTETRGNPLALLELPRGLTAAQLAGGFGLPAALSLQGTIEESYLKRLEALPEDTQQLLLVAAADPTGDQALLWLAAEQLGIIRATLEPAESAALIEVDSRVRFRHPLVRSAVYRAASPNDRRRVHQALAEATDAQIDPDRRAWHLAEAAPEPDEDVAIELKRAAARAQSRGGLAAAAAFLGRAAALTPQAARRAQRALAAAETMYESGALDDALALLRTSEAGDLNRLQRASGDLLRGRIAFASRRGYDAPPLLLKAARELEAVNPSLARDTYLEALEAARAAGPLARGAGAVEVSVAALARPRAPEPAGPSDLLLDGMATLFTGGFAAAAPILKAALAAFRRETESHVDELRWLPAACTAAADVWDDETWRLLAVRALERARSRGALTALPPFLTSLSYILGLSGELRAAQALFDEMGPVTEATGIPGRRNVGLWIAALRGQEAEALAVMDATTKEAVARGEGFILTVVSLSSAVLYNGLCRHEAAMGATRQAVDVEPTSRLASPRVVAELVEAAARCGERGLAARALERLLSTTRESGTEWALGVEARSRALLADGNAAEALYHEAIDRLGRTRLPLQLGRAHLVYGEWLRRERRRRDARKQLRAAFEMFDAMGTEAFARRAERELLATGERVRKRNVETRDELTAQEAKIARLARDGLSNAEIGERLFISQHTVAYHLRKVFSKLGITSRNQLEPALPESASARQLA